MIGGMRGRYFSGQKGVTWPGPSLGAVKTEYQAFRLQKELNGVAEGPGVRLDMLRHENHCFRQKGVQDVRDSTDPVGTSYAIACTERVGVHFTSRSVGGSKSISDLG
jgi:hypothetical protein